MVDGLAGEGDDPDLSHLDRGLFDAAAEAQNLAALRGVLHHLWDMVLHSGRASTQESANTHGQAGQETRGALGQSRLPEWGGQSRAWHLTADRGVSL